jgi:ribose 5-phosphate isomerase A
MPFRERKLRALVFVGLACALFGIAPAFLSLPTTARDLPALQRTLSQSTPPISSLQASGSTIASALTVALFVCLRSRGRSAMTVARATQDELKKLVGYKAVDDYVRSGTVIGLGTGSTAAFAVERVGQKLKSGELKDIIAIPTSIRTKEQAEALGIPLATLDTHSDLDVAIDGADEVDPDLNLVKGGGGALFREKIVELCAKKFIVIVDESKLCNGLGPGFPVPVEIVPFCHEHTMREIAKLPALAGCKPVLRLGNVANNKPDGDKPAVTDNGNYIVDLEFETPIKDAVAAGNQLKATVGVVDHGLFTGMTTACIVAGKDGIFVKEPKH